MSACHRGACGEAAEGQTGRRVKRSVRPRAAASGAHDTQHAAFAFSHVFCASSGLFHCSAPAPRQFCRVSEYLLLLFTSPLRCQRCCGDARRAGLVPRRTRSASSSSRTSLLPPPLYVLSHESPPLPRNCTRTNNHERKTDARRVATAGTNSLTVPPQRREGRAVSEVVPLTSAELDADEKLGGAMAIVRGHHLRSPTVEKEEGLRTPSFFGVSQRAVSCLLCFAHEVNVSFSPSFLFSLEFLYTLVHHTPFLLHLRLPALPYTVASLHRARADSNAPRSAGFFVRTPRARTPSHTDTHPHGHAYCRFIETRDTSSFARHLVCTHFHSLRRYTVKLD